MGIKLFTFVLFVLSIGAYFIPVKNIQNSVADKDLPIVVFEKPFMYTLDEKSIHRIVVASQAVKYQNRDEMFNADITLKNRDSTKNFTSERLLADFILKKADVYTAINNVRYTRDNFIRLNTHELIYDNTNKIAQNGKPFNGYYNNNLINGSNLYFDINNDYITAQNTHFEIDVTKKEKGKK